MSDWDGALDGYVVAVDLLHSVAPRDLVRDDQEFLLSRTVGLGAAAAACAVRCGRPGLAVGLLEQARGVILSHAFDADSDLTRLREAAPDLADRFEELREALDTATDSQGFLEEGPPGPDGARADLRQRLAAEWRDLIDRIRAEHPELGLLRPVQDWDERELCATAAAGPVVLVNVSPYGSDALLADASATHSAVVSALHRHAYAHFACHALGDLERASGSWLVLHDHTERPLTVRDLARLRLPSVRLAYLSACDTLYISPELADEAVHIVSAFQMAGFPHVVGSLWHVDDVIGAEVALSVYDTLNRGDGTLDVARTAEALHRAVRTLRDTYPETPSLWSCQVHAGPSSRTRS